MRVALFVLILSLKAVADLGGNDFSGRWVFEFSSTDRLVRNGETKYLKTELNVQKAVDDKHDYFVRWHFHAPLESLVRNFWCVGSKVRFRCTSEKADQETKQHFDLEFFSNDIAEVSNVNVWFDSYWYKKVSYNLSTYSLQKDSIYSIRIPTSLLNDLKPHAEAENLSVEKWAVRTLKDISDFLKNPAFKGRGVTFILDQSRVYINGSERK